MDNTAKRLMEMKKDIADKKVEKNRLEGKVQSLMARLKKEYKCDTIDEAGEKLDELEKELKKKKIKLKNGIEKLEELYEW
jgi:hypothetical protein